MKKNRLGRLGRLAVVSALVVSLAVPSAAFAAAPKKDEVKYLGSGKVEVEFDEDVDYKNVKVVVKDAKGNKVKSSIYYKDDDELRFKANKYKAGATYSFTISGVREEYTSSYGKVSGKYTVPKKLSNVKVEDINYLGSGKVEVEFDEDVDYKNAKVTVKDTSGKRYTATILSKNDDELRFKIKSYKSNKTYNFTISGIKEENQSKYRKAVGKVKIPKASKLITRAEAKNIALKDAGLKASQVWDLEVEKDDGRWEVNFETSNYEYEYEISKYGKILYRDKEWND